MEQRSPTEAVQGPDPVEGPVSMGGTMPRVTSVKDEFVDTSFAAETLIEEPITGGADSSLWECEAGDANCKPGVRDD